MNSEHVGGPPLIGWATRVDVSLPVVTCIVIGMLFAHLLLVVTYFSLAQVALV